MNTTTPLIKPPPPPSAGNLPSATTSTRAAHSEAPTIGEVLGVDLPLIGIVPYGLPPLILVAGWVLLALALTGPFLLLVTIALATGIVVAITAAILAPPYLLARSLHRYRARRPTSARSSTGSASATPQATVPRPSAAAQGSSSPRLIRSRRPRSCTPRRTSTRPSTYTKTQAPLTSE
jgi:hypothetical protein